MTKVAPSGWFELHNVGAKIGEQFSAIRAGNAAPSFDHLNPAEREMIRWRSICGSHGQPSIKQDLRGTGGIPGRMMCQLR